MLLVVDTGGTTVKGGATVGWQDLICAACSGRVVDARCGSCRAARDEFLAQRLTLPAGPLLALAAVLLTLLVVLTH